MKIKRIWCHKSRGGILKNESVINSQVDGLGWYAYHIIKRVSALMVEYAKKSDYMRIKFHDIFQVIVIYSGYISCSLK